MAGLYIFTLLLFCSRSFGMSSGRNSSNSTSTGSTYDIFQYIDLLIGSANGGINY